MKTTFKKGSLILEEGSRGHEAYIISSGRVRVFRVKNGAKVPLAVLGANQIFGEMGMLDDRPRSASVEALEDTEAVVVGPDEFASLSSSDPQLFMFILKTIFERLRSANQKIMELSVSLPEEQYVEGRVFLAGLTPEASAALGGQELEVRTFPFKVGRRTENSGNDAFTHNDLYLPDEEPYAVSRNHFSVECRGSAFFVADRGSHAGTLVNGSRIGGGSGKREQELSAGENIVEAGPEGSRFRFRITLK